MRDVFASVACFLRTSRPYDPLSSKDPITPERDIAKARALWLSVEYGQLACTIY